MAYKRRKKEKNYLISLIYLCFLRNFGELFVYLQIKKILPHMQMRRQTTCMTATPDKDMDKNNQSEKPNPKDS